MLLVLSLTPYALTKVFHTQMGYSDYADALVQYGEMSPMGLRWRFMAFSPTVQLLAGLAELLAVILLLFRRTAWLGALIAALDMGVVFLLNLTFDVPVKQLSGAMTLVALILLIPNLGRLVSFLLGRPTRAAVNGRIWKNRRFIAITRWTSPLLALVIIAGGGLAVGSSVGWGQSGEPTALSGVYSATAEGTATDIEGADHTTDDITQIAFSQHSVNGYSRASLRYSNGDYQDGTYSIDGDSVSLRLFPIRQGAQGLIRDYEAEIGFEYTRIGDDGFRLNTDGAEMMIRSDAERRFFFDRGFHWESDVPINR